LGIATAVHHGYIFTRHLGVPIFMAGGKPMLRFLVAIAAAAFFAGASYAAEAFEGAASSDEWYAAHQACRLGESVGGDELSNAQADEKCALRDRLTRELEAKGYCFDPSERVWAPCGRL
jgi:hypothetical protein